MTEPGPAARRKLPRVVVIGALAGVVVLGGAGLAFAESGHGTPSRHAAFASTGGSTSTTTTPGSSGKAGGPAVGPGPLRRFGIGGFRMGGFGLGGGLGAVVHGQFTVRSGSTYKTVDVQSGQVSDVSTTSITVTSPDGFKQKYAVVSSTRVDAQSGGISSVKVKDQVEVVATPQGSTQTATSVTDSTLLRSSKAHFGFAPPLRPGGNGTAGFGAPAGGTPNPQ